MRSAAWSATPRNREASVRDDTHVSRNTVRLDEQGFAELAASLSAFGEQVVRLERESAERLAAGQHSEPEITSSLILMLFDQPRRAAVGAKSSA